MKISKKAEKKMVNALYNYFKGDNDFNKLANDNSRDIEGMAKMLADEVSASILSEGNYLLDKECLDVSWLRINLTHKTYILVDMDDVRLTAKDNILDYPEKNED